MSNLRESFVDYFAKNNHLILPGSKLVLPASDSTLFTIAGMKQFTAVFLNQIPRPAPCVATIQPCLRVGGKQNDIESIGHTKRHHTFFEMLGNFSFYDYFKEQAIYYAYNYLTKVLQLDDRFLYVTVHISDQESIALWQKIANKTAIVIETEDNFWRSGDFGPCGPCSEIYYDQEELENRSLKDVKEIIQSGKDTILEVWNLVFMQYTNTLNGLVPLEYKSIDTGMGLERIASIVERTNDNFLTSYIKPILEVVCATLRLPYDNFGARIITDHMRSITMLLAEGLEPSNANQGYVLRKLIRRALKYTDSLAQFLPITCQTLSYHANLNEKIFHMQSKLIEEEKLYRNILEQLKSLSAPQDEKTLVKYYHTYGIPIEITMEYFSIGNFQQEKIDTHLQEHANSGQKVVANYDKPTNHTHVYEKETEHGSTIEHLMTFNGCAVNSANGECILITKSSNFYARGGGQKGDQGIFNTQGAYGIIFDTTKQHLNQDEYIILHHARIEAGCLTVGDNIKLSRNEELRMSHTRAHSATHLLSDYLWRNYGCVQSGSSVSDDQFTYDITCNQQLNLSEINNHLASIIDAAVDSYIVEKDLREVDNIMKLPDTTYGTKVRVVEFGDYSRQLCGGTHVKNTRDILKIIVLKNTSLQRGIRRLEALVGLRAKNYVPPIREEKIFSTLEYEMQKIGHNLLLDINSGEDKSIFKLIDGFKKECQVIIGITKDEKLFLWGTSEIFDELIKDHNFFAGKFSKEKINILKSKTPIEKIRIINLLNG